MEARAVAKFVRVAPRKVRRVSDLIKGKSVNEAIDILTFTPKAVSGTILKVVQSAVANAKQQDSALDTDELYIKNAYVDEGATLKRFRAGSMGRGFRIRKRTSHITVIVGD
ncbi:MAG: 50S ribosomal protein L22 [bacterium]